MNPVKPLIHNGKIVVGAAVEYGGTFWIVESGKDLGSSLKLIPVKFDPTRVSIDLDKAI